MATEKVPPEPEQNASETQVPASPFRRASKTQARARIAIAGPAGSGKTYTALRIAKGLSEKPAALIDTEAASAAKYADTFTFDVLALDAFDPRRCVALLAAAEAGGYEVAIVDSLSHFWQGKDGVMEQVDRRKANTKNQFAAWKEPSLMHQALMDAIVQSRIHIIATMRSKTEYALGEDGKPRRIGLAPVQRDDVEYIFDVYGILDRSHNLTIEKSRITSLADQVIALPGEDLGKHLREWLSTGTALSTATAIPQPTNKWVADPAELLETHTGADEAMDENAHQRSTIIEAIKRLKIAHKGQPRYHAAVRAATSMGLDSWSELFARGSLADLRAIRAILEGHDSSPKEPLP